MATLKLLDHLWTTRMAGGRALWKRALIQFQKYRIQLLNLETQPPPSDPVQETTPESSLPGPINPPYKDERDHSINVRDFDDDLVVDVAVPNPDPRTGQDVVNEALQDPAVMEAYLKSMAGRLGSPGQGFSNAFVYNGAIYSSRSTPGQQGTVVMYDTTQNKWVPYTRNANNASDWDRVLSQGYNLQISQYVPPPSGGSPGWTVQPDGSLRAGGGGGMSPAELYNASTGAPPQTGPAGDFTIPVDVGVGNMRWDGSQFIGPGNAPVNPILFQTYAPLLRQRGWTINGRQYTPPADFGVRAGSYPGTGTGGTGGTDKNTLGFDVRGGAKTVGLQ